MKINVNLLKCVKTIRSCRDLRVGDLLYKTSYEIRPGGYEYVICHRINDGARIEFRIDHLEDCFEVVSEDMYVLPKGHHHGCH